MAGLHNKDGKFKKDADSQRKFQLLRGVMPCIKNYSNSETKNIILTQYKSKKLSDASSAHNFMNNKKRQSFCCDGLEKFVNHLPGLL